MMWPAGPYALCWLAPGTRRVIRARLPMRTLDAALDWAITLRGIDSRAPFWLEAWQ